MPNINFKDHFSKQASEYHLYRPHYPPGLFKYLFTLTTRHEIAWDCATGNGQAALGIAPYFRQVIATDASKKQITQAMPHQKVTYQIAPAERTDIASATVELVTVAQALHWFDFEEFYAEVRRVLRPEGVLAIWHYNRAAISPEIDAIVR
ncbi:MAG: class I SAM-dependent methyltransferase, partial [bacterium]